MSLFLLTPLREGRPRQRRRGRSNRRDFYSRPCGRGDTEKEQLKAQLADFYSRPCGRGDRNAAGIPAHDFDFYSRPCGRGDPQRVALYVPGTQISTHAPAGGATEPSARSTTQISGFLLTPLREGRRGHGGHDINGAAYFYSRPCGRGDLDRLAEVVHEPNFYSRPCGRGDEAARRRINERIEFLLTPLREGRRGTITGIPTGGTISTHAPAGGATRRGLADRP